MLLDTSGLLCLIDAAEPKHANATNLFDAARTKLVHNYVLAELFPLAQVRGVPRSSVVEYVADLLENPDINVHWVDQRLHRSAMRLLLGRPDKTYSLCDAVSFLLMREYRLAEALTTDRHFEQEGFRRLLRP